MSDKKQQVVTTTLMSLWTKQNYEMVTIWV